MPIIPPGAAWPPPPPAPARPQRSEARRGEARRRAGPASATTLRRGLGPSPGAAQALTAPGRHRAGLEAGSGPALLPRRSRAARPRQTAAGGRDGPSCAAPAGVGPCPPRCGAGAQPGPGPRPGPAGSPQPAGPCGAAGAGSTAVPGGSGVVTLSCLTAAFWPRHPEICVFKQKFSPPHSLEIQTERKIPRNFFSPGKPPSK